MVVKGRTLCQILLGCCAVVMLSSRVTAPSALQRFDQPRTVSYTADIVVNGRWLLPRDMFGHVATKPPLVNWMAVPVVALGFWQEWAVKWPMVAGTLLTTALTVTIARNLFRQIPETAIVADEAAFIAGAAWLVNPANMTMIYHCRPDPVLVLFLTAAWMFATAIICENEPNKINIGGFSIAIGLAALTKGPAALVPIIYLPLAAWIIRGRAGFIRRGHWWWVILVGIGIFSLWAVPTAIRYPAAAILAAYFCATYLRRFRVRLWQVAALALVLALGLSVKHFRKTGKDRGGENLKLFACEVESRIDNEPVVFIGTGYNTLQFFLHRHQPGAPTAEQMAAAKWVIMPLRDDTPAELESSLVTKNQEMQFVLGLYRMENVRALIHPDAPPNLGRRPRS